MYSLRVNLALVLLIVLTATFELVKSERDFPGAIELVGFSSRRARMSEEPFGDTKYVTPPLKKEKADIETVKQNIEAYNRLLKVDTNKLSDQQKDMLERIVERVARLKAALDPAASNKTDNPSNSVEITVAMDATTTTPIIPTTLIATASSLSTAQATPLSSSTTTTTTTTSTTIKPTTKPDQTEARANNNNLSPSIGNNRVVSKSKVRQSTTQKPSSSSKATTKRTTGHHHRVSSMKPAAVSSSISTATTNTGLRSTTVTTIQPHQLKQYTKLQNQDIVHDDLAEEKTLPGGGSDLSPSAGSIVSDLIYDSNGTASSIIDSLANHAREDYYTRGPLSESTKEKKPIATAKPTKYHYYPHNQHIYLLPECAIQQVCNAVYVRLNYTQPLCACPSRYRDPCSASLNEDDQHTTKLIGNSKKKAITLAKTCEATTEMRECRSPKDWSLLALQNTRTGKSHYLVICRCPDHFKLEGPMAHDQPTYASVPGIRVFGMMCVKPGFSVRKPSVQPPKRYQLQKPFYMPTSNKYTTNKDSRPSYQDDSYQTQHQANYQYLNRPDSSPIITTANTQDFSDSLNNFGGVYGRNNERKGENVEAVTETEGSTISSSVVESTTSKDHKRERRSVNDDDDIPPFPWHRLEEFQQSVAWN